MNWIDFDPSHLDCLEPLERNGRVKMAALRGVVTQGYAVTLEVNGRPVACGGLVPIHPDRLVAWSIVTRDLPVLAAVRTIRIFLDKQTAYRIETTVDCDDRPSQRWLMALGFHRETAPLRYFNRDGSSAYLFVRFRDGA